MGGSRAASTSGLVCNRVSDTRKETTYQFLHQVRHTEAQQGMIGISGFGLGLVGRSECVGVITGIAGAGLESSKLRVATTDARAQLGDAMPPRGSELPIVGCVGTFPSGPSELKERQTKALDRPRKEGEGL